MRSLLRTRSGVFTLETALSLDEARALAAEGILADRIMAPDAPLAHLRAVEIPERWARQANAGGKIPAKGLAEDVPEEENLRAYLDGQFQGILHRSGEMLVWKMHF